MSNPDSPADLEPRLAQTLDAAVERLRAEFERRLDEARGELSDEMSRLARDARAEAEERAAKAEAEERAAKAEAEAEAAASRAAAAAVAPDDAGALEEFKQAVVRIDRASSQAEVLNALLEGSRRFASRAAVFLDRGDHLEGWDGAGFTGAATELQQLEMPQGGAWQRLARGEGAVALEPDDCAPLCERLEVPLPAVGVLIPMMLGDRVAAGLYADRLEGEGSLRVGALQLLTFSAGQVLETLPVRRRSSTSTLALAEPAPAEPAVEHEPEAAAPEIAPEPAAEPEAEALPEDDFETMRLKPLPELELVDAAAPALPAEVEAPDEEPPALTAPDLAEAPAEAAETEESTRPGLEAAPAPPQPAAPPAAPEPPPTPEPPALREAPPAPEPAPPPKPAEDDEASTQVRPPEDVDGPGWAFTTQPISTEYGEEALHEEARRLARLLVTEIKLYNEEEVEEGRRQRDLLDRLRDDIERSRQIWEDRIDPRIRGEQDYFQQALVRILAGGDAAALSG